MTRSEGTTASCEGLSCVPKRSWLKGLGVAGLEIEGVLGMMLKVALEEEILDGAVLRVGDGAWSLVEDAEVVGAVLECSLGSFLMIFFGPMVRRQTKRL